MFSRPLLLLTLLFGALPSHAAYRVSGRVNLGDEWQPKIFMAIVEKLGDYYRASPELIVKTAVIDVDGNFLLEGDELPSENRFYRLYLMKEQNTEYDACLYVGGENHNFIHLVLNNDSVIEVEADPGFYAPFGNYSIRGDLDNHLLRKLSRLVFPSYSFYEIKFPTELQLSEDKLFNDLKLFADTCSSPIIALAAVANMDMDKHFESNAEFFMNFGDRLPSVLASSPYTSDYLRKLRYYSEEPAVKTPQWLWWVIGLQSLVIGILVYQVYRLQKRGQVAGSMERQPNGERSGDDQPALSEILTTKELEILRLIRQGKSNKEISGELFIGISTVKTHINKIYTKLNISNRTEAMEKAKSYRV